MKENNDVSRGYDYGRMRRRMLQSWGKKDTDPAPKKEETARGEDKKRHTTFKVKQKSAKIKGEKSEFRIRKPAVFRTVEVLPKPEIKKFSASVISAEKRKAPEVVEVQGLKDKEKTGTGFSGNLESDARQWVIYDAVFGLPRSKRPWKPLR